jgi:DNA-directed RNA polymerase specialized sigma24 family protein
MGERPDIPRRIESESVDNGNCQKRSVDRAAEKQKRTEDGMVGELSLSEMLGSLPDDIAEIVALHVIAGLTIGDVSRITGKPQTTVFRKYRKGLGILRERLIKNEGAAGYE